MLQETHAAQFVLVYDDSLHIGRETVALYPFRGADDRLRGHHLKEVAHHFRTLGHEQSRLSPKLLQFQLPHALYPPFANHGDKVTIK